MCQENRLAVLQSEDAQLIKFNPSIKITIQVKYKSNIKNQKKLQAVL